ncbi:MAG: hypothetical protein ACKVI4_17015, partial [Actinomycetales bacterium]
QAATANARTVCEYGNALLREYSRRFGGVHGANESMQTAVRVVMRSVAESDARDDDHPCKLRPRILNPKDLHDAATMLHGDAYAERLIGKIWPLEMDGGDRNACICAFSLGVPGNTEQQNTLLTDSLYNLMRHTYVTARGHNANACIGQIGILFHCYYYVCKIYTGTGQRRKQLAFWGFENTIPCHLGLTLLPCVIQCVFLPNDVPPVPQDAEDRAPRRLPSSKCRAPCQTLTVPMMYPSMVLDDAISSDDATSDSDEENLAPNVFV